MREAHLALEEAEQHGASVRELERVATTFDQTVTIYEAAILACAAHAPCEGMGTAASQEAASPPASDGAHAPVKKQAEHGVRQDADAAPPCSSRGRLGNLNTLKQAESPESF
jgi:hypothetical protein